MNISTNAGVGLRPTPELVALSWACAWLHYAGPARGRVREPAEALAHPAALAATRAVREALEDPAWAPGLAETDAVMTALCELMN
jgi:hypothetical protein